MASNCTPRDNFGMCASSGVGPGPCLKGANKLPGVDAYGKDGKDLGDIKEVAKDASQK